MEDPKPGQSQARLAWQEKIIDHVVPDREGKNLEFVNSMWVRTYV